MNIANLKRAIDHSCQLKYGRHISVTFDQLEPESEHRAAVIFTISDRHGFITRHYGHAGYEDDHLYLHTMTI